MCSCWRGTFRDNYDPISVVMQVGTGWWLSRLHGYRPLAMFGGHYPAVLCCYLQHTHHIILFFFLIIQSLTPPDSTEMPVSECDSSLCKRLQGICQTRCRVMLKSLFWFCRGFLQAYYTHRWDTNSENTCNHIGSKIRVNLWSSVACFLIISEFCRNPESILRLCTEVICK